MIDAPVVLRLDGGCQPTENGTVNTGTDNILSIQALFGLLNATKRGKQLPHEFRAGREAWNACYTLFEDAAFITPGASVRLPAHDVDPEKFELAFAGVPVKYDSTIPTDNIQSWHIGLLEDKELGRLVGVTR